MNGYEKRTNAKKNAIIDAALQLFIERGITEVSISEIAARAKVSQVSIYNYFGDKHNLAKAVLTFYLDQSILGYEEILERDIPFAEKLRLIMDKKNDIVVKIAPSLFSEYAWEDKALQQVYKEATAARAVAIYMKFIELGKKEGAINTDIPNDAILSYILSSVSIMQRPDYFNSSPEYKTGILQLFLYGLIGKDESGDSLSSRFN